MAKRTGWIRLGVVVSAVWVVAVLVYTAAHHHNIYNDLAVEAAVQDLTQDERVKAGGWETIGQETMLLNCDIKQKQVTCNLRIGNLALLILGPIAVAWLISVAVVFAVIWVRAGFRRRD